MLGICVGAAIELERFIQDFLNLFVRLWLFLVLHSTVRPDALNERLVYPSAAKSIAQKTAKLGHDRRLRSVREIGQPLNLEGLKKIHIEFTHRVDAAALTVLFEPAEMKFVLAERLLAEFAFVRCQVLLDTLFNRRSVRLLLLIG